MMDHIDLSTACFPPQRLFSGTDKQKQRKRTQVKWDTPCGYRTFSTARLILMAYLHLPLSHDEGVVCHACNNSSCLNPLHLYLGTQSENLEDAHAIGTAYKRSSQKI